MKRYIYLFIIMSLIMVFTGCGNGLNIKTDEGTISLKDGKMEVTGKDGEKGSISVNNDGIKVDSSDGSGAQISINDNGIQVNSNDGSSGSISVGENGMYIEKNENGKTSKAYIGVGLPEGYPEDIVPIIDGANLVGGGMKIEKEFEGKKGDAFIISATVDKNIDDIFAYYKDELSDAEKVHEESPINKVHVLYAVKKGKEIMVQMISVEDKLTTLNISIHPFNNGEVYTW